MTTPGPITRLGAQRAARHELSKAIYHRNREPWPVRLVRAVGHWLDHALSGTLDKAPSGSAGAIAIVVVLAVVAAVLIWRVGPPRRAAGIGSVFALAQPTSAAEHRAHAERAAATGDWRTAVIERTRALARELEERGVVESRPGRTATELARDAGRALPDAAPALTAASEVFNAIAYGDAAATPDDLDLVVAADQAVRRRSTVLAR
jgi:hypothetical protein